MSNVKKVIDTMAKCKTTIGFTDRGSHNGSWDYRWPYSKMIHTSTKFIEHYLESIHYHASCTLSLDWIHEEFHTLWYLPQLVQYPVEFIYVKK